MLSVYYEYHQSFAHISSVSFENDFDLVLIHCISPY